MGLGLLARRGVSARWTRRKEGRHPEGLLHIISTGRQWVYYIFYILLNRKELLF
jgi:hypothetical protein